MADEIRTPEEIREDVRVDETSLLGQWRAKAYDQNADKRYMERFWNEYFEMEKGIYKQLLADPSAEVRGTVKELAEKYQVEMPIVDVVNAVLFDGLSAKEGVTNLMTREKVPENPAITWK